MKRLRHYNQGTAIVLSCFGSIVEQQRYEVLAERVRQNYPDVPVHIATSSKMVIKKLARKEVHCKSLPQVLADLDTQGYEHILVVSVYLFPTDEHRYLTSIVEGFTWLNLFTASSEIFDTSKKPIFPSKNFETATSFAAFKTTPKSRLFKISSRRLVVI